MNKTMKNTSMFGVMICSFLILMIFTSCAGLKDSSGSMIDDPSQPFSSRSTYDDKLNTSTFAALPEEAKSYLQTLSKAFQLQDTDFILVQGEAMFEKLVRPYYDDTEYFIMLYRIGGEDNSLAYEKQDISISDIKYIEYTGWESGDPVMKIRGRIMYNSNQFVPCTIMLAWKLDEAKIIGLYP